MGPLHRSHGQIPPNRLYLPMDISSHLWISTKSMEKHTVLPLIHYHLRLYTSHLLLPLPLQWMSHCRFNEWAHKRPFGPWSHRRKCSHVWPFRHKYLVLFRAFFFFHYHCSHRLPSHCTESTSSSNIVFKYRLSILMSTSAALAAAQIAPTLPPMQGNEAPTSSSLNTMVEPFNSQARQAFYHMLDSRKDHTRERVTTSQKLKYIKWLTTANPDRLDSVDGKKRAWVRSDFEYQYGKLWKLPGRVFKERREVISDDLIWDTIITVHNSLGHTG